MMRIDVTLSGPPRNMPGGAEQSAGIGARATPISGIRLSDRDGRDEPGHDALGGLRIRVMAGLVPAISIGMGSSLTGRDGRDELGHDTLRAAMTRRMRRPWNRP